MMRTATWFRRTLPVAAMLAVPVLLAVQWAGTATAGGGADPGPDEAPALSPWLEPGVPAEPLPVYTRFETLTVDDGLPSKKVTTVLADGEDLWVGTDHGLARRRDGKWTYWTEADGLGHRYVTSLALDRRTGDLWISTFGGLSRLSGGRITNFTQLNSGLMNDVVYHVVTEGDQVWAATAAGTSRYATTAGTWALYDHQNSIMHEPWCYALALGPGRTWIGVWGGGVVEIDHTTGNWREYRDPDHEMEIDLLRDDGPIHDVTAFVAYDAGVLWQATYFGLSRYDGRRWRTYRKEDSGLPGNFINHISARGRTAFVGTDEGFGVTDGETFHSYKRLENGRGEVVTTRDGEVVERRTLDTAPADNYILWAQAGEDDVWLATGRGLTHGRTAAP